MDPELDAFVPFLPKVDMSDAVAAREEPARVAAAAPKALAALPETADMEIEDRAVPADPGVPVRIYRPAGTLGADPDGIAVGGHSSGGRLAAAAPGGRPGRAAPVARHVPRLAGDHVRRGVAAAGRRTRCRPAPRTGRVGRTPGVSLTARQVCTTLGVRSWTNSEEP